MGAEHSGRAAQGEKAVAHQIFDDDAVAPGLDAGGVGDAVRIVPNDAVQTHLGSCQDNVADGLSKARIHVGLHVRRAGEVGRREIYGARALDTVSMRRNTVRCANRAARLLLTAAAR